MGWVEGKGWREERRRRRGGEARRAEEEGRREREGNRTIVRSFGVKFQLVRTLQPSLDLQYG